MWSVPSLAAMPAQRLVGAVLAEQNDERAEITPLHGTEILAACRKGTKKDSDEAGMTIEALVFK